jgi:hypothetical protein
MWDNQVKDVKHNYNVTKYSPACNNKALKLRLALNYDGLYCCYIWPVKVTIIFSPGTPSLNCFTPGEKYLCTRWIRGRLEQPDSLIIQSTA